MRWEKIDEWYCVTICGLMSWKFQDLREGIRWALVMKEARDFEATWVTQK